MERSVRNECPGPWTVCMRFTQGTHDCISFLHFLNKSKHSFEKTAETFSDKAHRRRLKLGDKAGLACEQAL